jgi:hypothetical protein
MDHGTHATGKKEDNTPANVDEEFIAWLTKTKLLSYQQSLEDEGYDSKESLVLLTDDEIDELSSTIKMKAGHKKRFPVEIREAREEIQLQKDLAKLQRGEVLREAQDRASTKTKARDHTVDAEDQKMKVDESSTNPTSMQPAAVDEAGKKEANKKQNLPLHKKWHFFASHKKLHSRHANASEMLARSTIDVLNNDHIRGFFDIDSLKVRSRTCKWFHSCYI